MNSKEYFKPKIDWKFFNAILDFIMKYEDSGTECTIRIKVENNDVDPRTIAYYINSKTEFLIINSDTKHYISMVDSYERYGKFIYEVGIHNNHYAQEFMHGFPYEKYGYTLTLDVLTCLEFKIVN